MLSSHDAYIKSPHSSRKHSTYFTVYDKILSRFIGKEITFVEVGVLNGGSLFMWREFFGENARIIGIDLNPDAKGWEENGFEIHIGNQADPAFWADFFQKVGNVDVLLDDGGHTYEQQIITAESALPCIKDGGLLIVEDTHTSYMKEFGGPTALSFINYAKNKADGLNYRCWRFRHKEPDRQIFSIQFFESFVVFEVDRNLCAVESEPTINRVQSVNAIDFCYSGTPLFTLDNKLRGFGFLGNIPLIGGALVSAYRFARGALHFVHNKFRSRAMKKYFKF